MAGTIVTHTKGPTLSQPPLPDPPADAEGPSSPAVDQTGGSTRDVRFADRATLFVATLGYLGFFSKAPGTVATLIVGVLSVLLLRELHWSAHAAARALVFALSCFTSGRAADLLGEEDSGKVVIDELAGFLVAMFLLPVNWRTLGLCFILFRVFDILKPWPVSWADKRLPGGWGVTVDDVLAGLYTLVLGHVACAMWPEVMSRP